MCLYNSAGEGEIDIAIAADTESGIVNILFHGPVVGFGLPFKEAMRLSQSIKEQAWKVRAAEVLAESNCLDMRRNKDRIRHPFAPGEFLPRCHFQYIEGRRILCNDIDNDRHGKTCSKRCKTTTLQSNECTSKEKTKCH